ncbi:hypothetical protein [Sorangium sp. So ce394]|uniref:hypothetical protein n=1 Tax=Sorangium sp. So ce394 TaxID=3133310 RepID=UPI003F5AEDC0
MAGAIAFDSVELSSRRAIAKVIHRTLALATHPARIIANNPPPRGWIPKADDNKVKGSLYPDEDRRLIQAVTLPSGNLPDDVGVVLGERVG